MEVWESSRSRRLDMFPMSEGRDPMSRGFYETCRTLRLLRLVNSWGNLPSIRWIWDRVPSKNPEQRRSLPHVSACSQRAQYSGLGWFSEGTRLIFAHVPTASCGENTGSSLPPCRAVSHQYNWHRTKSIIEVDWPICRQNTPSPVASPHFFIDFR